MKAAGDRHEFEVIADLDVFDRGSGNPIERALFNYRWLLVTLCALITALLAVEATKLQLNASFVKTIPSEHPFVLNYLEHESDLKGLTNVVRIVVEARAGQDIFDPAYLDLCGSAGARRV